MCTEGASPIVHQRRPLVTVKKNERGLLLRNGDFERVLQPGAHWLFAGLDALRVELNENQVGLRSENGTLVELLAPATRRLYWKGLVDVQVEVIDIGASAELPAALVARLAQTQLRQRAVQGLAGVLQVRVPEHGAGILWVDGKVERLLGAGSFAFWKFNRNVSVELVDLRLQALEVTGQEILTRDKSRCG